MSYLQRFQEQNGLSPDGLIGPNTFNKMKEVFGLSGVELAMFLGQVSHETAGFKYGYENLNYSESGLRRVFRRYFTPEQAKEYARKPQRIASRVYANRMGNGNEESGDGWKYRGRGSLQLTGKNNYERFANKVRDMSILNNPDLVTEKYYFESALYFFAQNNLWRFCQEHSKINVLKLSKAINLGNPNSSATPNGLDDRFKQTQKFLKLI